MRPPLPAGITAPLHCGVSQPRRSDQLPPRSCLHISYTFNPTLEERQPCHLLEPWNQKQRVSAMVTIILRRMGVLEPFFETYTGTMLTICSRGILFDAAFCQPEQSANVNDSDYASKEDSIPSVSLCLQKRDLASWASPVHRELVKAAAEGQHTTRLKYLLAQGANIDAWG
jgi:hypothetical protein